MLSVLTSRTLVLLWHRNGTVTVSGDYNFAEVLATHYVLDNSTVSECAGAGARRPCARSAVLLCTACMLT